jgi:hypothetical protein
MELAYPNTGRTVYAVRSSLTSGASLFLFNNSTLFYEAVNLANAAQYACPLTEVAPRLYRGVVPSASLSIPATEYFYDQQGGSPNLTNDIMIGSGNSQGVDLQQINGNTNNGIGLNVSAIVDICNMALRHIGQKPITTLSDDTENARLCNQFFNTCRDAVLRGVSWNFATIVDSLVQLPNESVTGWSYVYSIPATCLYIRKVYCDDTCVFQQPIFPTTPNFLTPTTNPRPQPYKVVYDSNISAMVIVANIQPAYIEYTARIIDPSFYDPLFIEALAYKLASQLASPLCGDPEEAKEMVQYYLAAISEAARQNGNENGVPRSDASAYMDVR